MDGEASAWPLDKLRALRLGRRLVAEVPAARGRRAFVDITPILDHRGHQAGRQGWQRADPGRSFRLAHWNYDERQIDDWDHDVDAKHIRTDTASDESGLLAVIAEWGLQPTQFAYPWDTDDPR